ncbi:MAG: hypothetical protein Kow0059_14910 [Candidatus Sumerlaeia bacterium]
MWLAAVLLGLSALQARGGFLPLPNPGFELDADQNGLPDGWNVGLGLIYDASGTESHTGQAAVRFNRPGRALADLAPPMLSALTLRAWMRASPADGQRGDLSIQYYRGSQFLGFAQRQLELSTSWGLRGVSAQLPPAADRILPVLRSNSVQTWVWADDVDLLTDRLDNGMLEELDGGALRAWSVVGLPTLDLIGGVSAVSPTAVVCNRNNYVFQPVACSPTTRTYTLQFQVRAASSVSDGALVKWYDAQGRYFAKTELAFEAGSNWRPVAAEFTAPAGAVWGEVSLQPAGEAWVWFDDLFMGWQNVSPPALTPNDDDINDTATLYYYLPMDAATTVTLLGPDGAVVRVLQASPEGAAAGVYAVQFDGTGAGTGAGDTGGGMNAGAGSESILLPEGLYRFRLETAGRDGARLAVECPVMLRERPGMFERPLPAGDVVFVSGVWEYVFGIEFATFSSFADLVERAVQWHFNSVLMLFLKEEDFSAAYGALSGSGVMGITHNYFLNSVIDDQRFPWGFDEEHMRALLLDYAGRFGGNPEWFGIYLKDEPLLRDADALRAAVRMSENLAPGRLPLSTFQVNADAAELAGRVRPPVLMFDYYPIQTASAPGVDQWADYVAALDQARTVAHQAARPWWLVAQGFYSSAVRRPPLPAEQRAIVGLALAEGASGILYFIRSTFGGTEGLLDNEFRPSALLTEVLTQNARLAGLGPYLAGLRESDFPILLSEAQCFARTFRDGEDRPVIVLVNMNSRLPCTPILSVDAGMGGRGAEELQGGTGGELTARPLPAVRIGNESRVAVPQLAPGDWIVVRLTP